MNAFLVNNLKGAFSGFLWRNPNYNIVCETMNRPYDIVVYGATGFTGKYVAAEAFRTRCGKKIAIAGRNKSKLEKILDFMKEENGGEDVHSHVGIVVADSSDDASILEMCRQSRVVVNCVGPYTFYGEQIVRACVETGTHHVDISGEPQFLQMCQLKFDDEAKSKGIHIVGTCGFDSVPADVGLELLREKFPGELTSAESYIHTRGAGKANTGTYNSIVQAIVEQNVINEQTKLIFKDNLSYIGPLSTRRFIGWAESENKYFIPFMGPDQSVVKRTQLFESSVHGKTPIAYHAYFTIHSILHLICMMIFGLMLVILTKFELGIKLLLAFPWFFSFGTFSSQGVNRKDLDRSGFKVVIHGKGYRIKPKSAIAAGIPDRNMTLVFKGPEMAYIYTSISIIAAAHTILEDKLLNQGGVLTPGSAFQGTGFVDRLKKRGVQISVS